MYVVPSAPRNLLITRELDDVPASLNKVFQCTAARWTSGARCAGPLLSFY